MNFSSQPCPINQAFGSCSLEEKLQFDVVTSFQNSPNAPSINSPIIGCSLRNVKKQYYGTVTIKKPINNDNNIIIGYVESPTTKKLVGYDYEVYSSNKSSDDTECILKGQTRYTNISTFTFPIKDITQDYFVLVTPYIETTKLVNQFKWTQLELQSSGGLMKQPNLQLRNEPHPNSSKEESTIDAGERLFKIFYTQKIIRDRKQKINLYKTDKKHNEYINSHLPTLSFDPLVITKQREQDLKNIEELKKNKQQKVFNEVVAPVPLNEYKKMLYDFSKDKKAQSVNWNHDNFVKPSRFLSKNNGSKIEQFNNSTSIAKIIGKPLKSQKTLKIRCDVSKLNVENDDLPQLSEMTEDTNSKRRFTLKESNEAIAELDKILKELEEPQDCLKEKDSPLFEYQHSNEDSFEIDSDEWSTVSSCESSSEEYYIAPPKINKFTKV